MDFTYVLVAVVVFLLFWVIVVNFSDASRAAGERRRFDQWRKRNDAWREKFTRRATQARRP